MNYRSTSSGVHLYDIDSFSIHQIANSGQCFRCQEIDHNLYQVIASDRCVNIRQDLTENSALFDCSIHEFEGFWYDYFDFRRDYSYIKSMVDPNDSFLSSAIQYGHGLRILRQDPWEMLITFIISQQNNIPRITGIVDRLCRYVGSRYTKGNSIYHAFPTPEQILQNPKGVESARLGFRYKYVMAAAEKYLADGGLDHLYSVDSLTCTNELKKYYGVGDKVANCISLFGLEHTDAFPIDVWIRRIIDEYYLGDFDIAKYSPYSGIIQQYMFYYGRMIK